jgi:hypothetical protein
VGPIALFDKSFLQSLTVDEAVWFAHFFMPVVCPMFYVETLADLDKAVRDGRTPEREVGIIAEKFPDASAAPCAYHLNLAFSELSGASIDMDGRIPRAGGTAVTLDGKWGWVFDRSPEEVAFSRWSQGKFLDVERGVAARWRSTLNSVDLAVIAKAIQEGGVNARTCKSLEDARAMAHAAIASTKDPYQTLGSILTLLSIPREYHTRIIERWAVQCGKAPLQKCFPYCSHIMQIELFFYLALAAGHIGTARPSNRTDMTYLYYLPFCQMFVSSDRLHERSAPLFMREDQRFVWGADLKEDLKQINLYYEELPESEKEKGLSHIAYAPPKREGSLVRELRAQFLGKGYDDAPRVTAPEDPEKERQLVEELNRWVEAEPADPSEAPTDYERGDTMAFKRSVRLRKGSWWQLPKDLGTKDKKGPKRD